MLLLSKFPTLEFGLFAFLPSLWSSAMGKGLESNGARSWQGNYGVEA